jgi:hypothetical protein
MLSSESLAVDGAAPGEQLELRLSIINQVRPSDYISGSSIRATEGVSILYLISMELQPSAESTIRCVAARIRHLYPVKASVASRVAAVGVERQRRDRCQPRAAPWVSIEQNQ